MDLTATWDDLWVRADAAGLWPPDWLRSEVDLLEVLDPAPDPRRGLDPAARAFIESA